MVSDISEMRNTHFIPNFENAQLALRDAHVNPTITPMKVGERIREIRKAKGLKLSEVENRAGLTEGNLSRIERGVQWLSEDKFYALAAALGVAPTQFFGPAEAAPGQLDPDVLVGIIKVLRELTPELQRLALAQVQNVGLVAGMRTTMAITDQSQTK